MTRDSREIEIKLRLERPASIEKVLTKHGFAVTRSRVFESNTLYDDSAAGLRSRGCALRIREVGERVVLTYKGPPDKAKHKSREELETVAGDAQVLAAIFQRIGFVSQFRYEKYRTEWERPGEVGTVTVDETPIGWFLELEGQPDWIDRTAAELGFREEDYVTESYVALYSTYCMGQGIVSQMMIFHPEA